MSAEQPVIWGKHEPYIAAGALLLSYLSDGLPQPHFWSVEANEEKIAVAVCKATGLTPSDWKRLSPPERVPWLEAAIEQQAAARSKSAPVRAPRVAASAKPASVNQRMAAMLQSDPSLADLPASEWAQKLGCSAAAVKQSETWKEPIMKLRAIQERERAERDSRKHLQ